jgi:hypothetical protein
MNIKIPTDTFVPPVAVGGVGGSGTRLIARCLIGLGFFMGSDLNEAYDNLWFTLLFKRVEILHSTDNEFQEAVRIFLTGMTGKGSFTDSQIRLVKKLSASGREQHPWLWLRKRRKSLLKNTRTARVDGLWGWKEPNTHVVLERLLKSFPDMKYIHVMRNGLDMAHSSNQNQLKLWGPLFLGPDCVLSPRFSLRYWCEVHRRVLEIGKHMGDRFLLLNYDDLCINPRKRLEELVSFLALNASETEKGRLAGLARPPQSIGRFKQYGTNMFDAVDVAFVKSLGFDTGEAVNS